MEPFELKLHQVTFEESDNALGQVEGQPQSQLDSFSALVHYDADFEDGARSEIAAEHTHLQDLTFAKLGKDQRQGKSSSASHPSYSATTTTTTSSSARPRPTCTLDTPPPPHSPPPPPPPPPSVPLPWEGKYAGDEDGQENFLVNPDDYYLSPRSHRATAKVSPEVAAAGLQALSQVSINTSAVARHLRKVKAGKRRVAKTVLTSTALTTPTTMPTESPRASSGSGPAGGTTAAAASPPAGEIGAEEPEDSSFETVAEALRLQWSVIGNANVTPASPEEVARIVAEAEKRLRGETGSDIAGEVLPGDPNVSDLPSVGSLSSLSSLSSSATNDNGIPGADAQVGRVPEPGERARPAELIRIPAKSITKEVEKTSWFQTKDKPSVSSPRAPDNVDDTSRTGAEGGRGANGDTPVERAHSLSSSSSSSGGLVKGSSGPESAGQNGREVTRDGSGLSVPDGRVRSDGPAQSVPLGSGGVAPSDLGVKPPAGSMPYTTQTPTTPETPPLSQHAFRGQHANSPQQQSESERQPGPAQNPAAPPRQFVLPLSPHPAGQQQLTPSGQPPPRPSPHSSPLYPSSPQAAVADGAELSSYAPSPLPSPFQPNLVPIPQIGPLFPRKAGGMAVVAQGHVSRTVVAGAEGEGGGRQLEELMREKLKLEGQLEVLQEEAQSTLQERAELQAQLASMQLRLKSNQQKADDAEKAVLRAELERLRATRLDHEREAVEVQHMLEEKLEELKAVTEDLYQAQDSVDKLQVRMKELRDDLQAKDATIQALKSKIAELYVEVQTTLQNKMEADSEARTARNDLVSLVKAKEWYQEQLSTAHEVRAKLQSQLTQLQAQTVSQGSIVERLKLESGRLRQQLRESQERALREKEQLARHLEAIQQDMMEREAAFQEIQRERLMIEDTFNTQVTTAEEEKSRISSLLQLTSDLESQLEQAQGHSKKRQEQILRLEMEQMELMKKAAVAQEALVEKEHLLAEADQKLIEVESQLEAFTQTLAAKDGELRKLREDKASTEIALKAALQEKESVDKALDVLKGDMGKVEKSFKQMRQELGVRVTELETAQTQQKAARDELDRVAHELDIKARSVDTLTQNYQEQAALIEQLRAEKNSSEQLVSSLKQQLHQTQAVRPEDSSLQQALQTELQETRARLTEAEDRLQVSTAQLQQTAATMALQPQEAPPVSDEQLQAALAERDRLAEQLRDAEEAKQRAESEAEKKREELDEAVAGLRSQLHDGRTEFERKVEEYAGQVRQGVEEKRRLETELEMTRRKFELSSVQQQESINSELQKLVKELEGAQLLKQEVEQQLYALRSEKEAEVASLRQQLAGMQQSLEEAQQQQQQDQQDQQDRADLSQQLSLELERERGRMAGLQQSNSTLKEHMKQLEEALAGRESSLMELKSHLENGNREREKEQHEYLRRIQELEVSLKKEKDGGRDLRKQIGSKMTENRRLQKQQEALRKEQGDLQEQVDGGRQEATRLQAQLEAARQAVRDQQGSLQSLQAEKLAAEAELERARRELVDNRDRNPVLLEQIQSLEWQVAQRSQEVQAAREQLALTEQRQTAEVDSLRRALQDKQDEVDSLQGELSSAKQEKADQKSRVSELRSVLKASVQHHKLTKKLNSRKKERGGGDADGREEKGTQADMGNGVIIPPLPFDMEAVEQLLLDTAVTPLDSKPLDNLSTCLSSLRAEISGLQKQMEVHTTTIHSSTVSWRNVENEVKGLQEVVRSIANTIMDGNHTTTSATITTAATDTEMVDDGDIVHL